MLRAYRKDRIILLTTHYMDEADILGDRIGIMTAGKLTCLGSSMFLKNRFGMGYVMTVVKRDHAENEKIIPYLAERLGPEVMKLTEIRGEMTVQIPREYTFKFKDFFSEFDNDLAALDIQSYGISITTLEQVFLEIGHDPNPQPKVASLIKKSELNVTGHRSSESVSPQHKGSDGNSDLDNQLLRGPLNPKGLEFEEGVVETPLPVLLMAKERSDPKK